MTPPILKRDFAERIHNAPTSGDSPTPARGWQKSSNAPEDDDEYLGGNGAPVLQFIELPANVAFDWRVDKMKLSKDKTQLKYNDYLILDGIPSRAFDYRLGNRSALEWVIDQYRVKTDKRSGIVNDPNRDDDPQYIIRLIRKVITVSLETVSIVEDLPPLKLG